MGLACAGNLSALRLLPLRVLLVGTFWQVRFWGEQEEDGDPPRALGQWGLTGSKAPRSQSAERAEWVTCKHAGTEPPPQGEGGERIKTERT